MSQGTIALIGLACSLLGVIISYAVFSHNSKKDTKDEGETVGTMLTEIGYIKSGVDDIKTEQREQRKTNVEFVSRLTAVEASAKQAHKRIDRIEGSEDRES